MTLSRYVAWRFDEFVFITINQNYHNKKPTQIEWVFYGYGFNLE